MASKDSRIRLPLEDYLEAENDADMILNILKDKKITKPPVPLWIIPNIVPGTIIDSSRKFFEGALGFSFFDFLNTRKWQILINEDLPYGAQRFTAFHEFYHILKQKPGFKRGSVDAKLEEKRADVFSACLLMPAQWFRKYWEETYNLDEMAKIFGVSREAVKVRFRSLDHYIKKV